MGNKLSNDGGMIMWTEILKLKAIKVGLIEGRHPLPVDEYIFQSLPQEGSLADKIPQLRDIANTWIEGINGDVDLYVTGMTPVLTAFLRAWGNRKGLALLHYDVSNKDYWREEWN